MTDQPVLNRKEATQTFLLAVGYALFFYCTQFFLYKAGLVRILPDTQNLLHWDCSWYRDIATNGYEFSGEHSSNSGFFILFPLVWKLVGVHVWGICLLNILFFAAGFSVLTSMFRLSVTDKLLWLSVPTVYFAFIPYTEALFFFLCSLMLYGMHTRNNRLIMGSLFLLSLTRVVVVFVMPGLLAMCLMEDDRKHWLKSLLRFSWLYLLPGMLGLGAFIVYQYTQTHVWFAYFIQQQKFWRHEFYGLPGLPWQVLGGNALAGISALAVFADLAALICILYMGIRWLAKNVRPTNPLLVPSTMYLFLVLYFTAFYSPSYGGNMTRTDSMGIFRYSMMSPFFYVFLQHFTTQRQYRWQHYLAAFLLVNVAYLSFGSYLHLQSMLFFNFNTILVFLFMRNAQDNKLSALAIALNFLMQVQLFQLFIDNGIYPD